ncbi:hypothetical protein P8935_24150 [Telmatobacter sp. DSM 110680]|uniref:Uncharacterized protein n=1 Tax=Telmatobacter sp. DSM 110680 TaxID=3036704 RepID=A0AAU7DKP1_9BACT
MGLPDSDGPFKLRATSGKHDGVWLETLDVWQGDTPVVHIPNWELVFRNRSEYRFVPNFTNAQQFAYRYSFRKLVEIHRAILAELLIETEIIARPLGRIGGQ